MIFGSSSFLPGWENATGWSRTSVFLTPEETSDLRRQMRGLLEPYEGRKSSPALRPPGALPVEWTVSLPRFPEPAGFGEAHRARLRRPKRKDGPGRGPEA